MISGEDEGEGNCAVGDGGYNSAIESGDLTGSREFLQGELKPRCQSRMNEVIIRPRVNKGLEGSGLLSPQETSRYQDAFGRAGSGGGMAHQCALSH